MALQRGDTVQAQRGRLRRWLLPSRARTGVIAYQEVGRYSGEQLHTVVFDDRKKPEVDVFFDHELQPAA